MLKVLRVSAYINLYYADKVKNCVHAILVHYIPLASLECSYTYTMLPV